MVIKQCDFYQLIRIQLNDKTEIDCIRIPYNRKDLNNDIVIPVGGYHLISDEMNVLNSGNLNKLKINSSLELIFDKLQYSSFNIKHIKNEIFKYQTRNCSDYCIKINKKVYDKNVCCYLGNPIKINLESKCSLINQNPMDHNGFIDYVDKFRTCPNCYKESLQFNEDHDSPDSSLLFECNFCNMKLSLKIGDI